MKIKQKCLYLYGKRIFKTKSPASQLSSKSYQMAEVAGKGKTINQATIMDKKNRINVVYSTNPDFNYEYDQKEASETLLPEKQNLRVTLDSKQRAGKVVTLVQGFVGQEEDLKELAKLLKNKCGVGGSVKDGEIVIQGALKDKILNVLKENRYRAK